MRLGSCSLFPNKWLVGFSDWPLKTQDALRSIKTANMEKSKKLAKWLGWAVVVAALIVCAMAWMDQ